MSYIEGIAAHGHRGAKLAVMQQEEKSLVLAVRRRGRGRAEVASRRFAYLGMCYPHWPIRPSCDQPAGLGLAGSSLPETALPRERGRWDTWGRRARRRRTVLARLPASMAPWQGMRDFLSDFMARRARGRCTQPGC